MSLAGHYWTIRPWLRDLVRPPAEPGWIPFSHVVDDPRHGAVRLSGRYSPGVDRRRLVIVSHGLGGMPEAPYCTHAARAVLAAGVSCLRLAMRGADGSGEDLYHAALTGDLDQVLGSPQLTDVDQVYLLGFSLGGHLALRYATGQPTPRVRAVAAISPPLDLARTTAVLDGPGAWPYRQIVLLGLKRQYAQVSARRRLSTPTRRILRVGSIREWDRLAVVPRFGFESVDAYYDRVSVGPRLRGLKIPALLAAAAADPMVPGHTLAPWLTDTSPLLDLRWLPGGHVGFAPGARVGVPGDTVTAQAVSWLLGH